MANQFTGSYKKLSTAKLLDIIENRKDYQALAVEAAQLELESRQDIEQAKLELDDKKIRVQKEAEEQTQKRKEISDKAFKILEYADPLVEKTPEKSIVVLCVLLLMLFIYKTATSFYMIAFTVEGLADGDWSAYLFVIEYLYLPVNIFMLWRKSKAGWTMFLIWLLYGILADIILLYYTYKMTGAEGPLTGLMPGPGFSGYLFILAFHAGLLYFICKPNIKALFSKTVGHGSTSSP